MHLPASHVVVLAASPEPELASDLPPGLLDPPVHLLLLLEHSPVLLLLLHLQAFEHRVLLGVGLGHVPHVVLHVLPLDLLHPLRLVLPLLHTQIRIVLIRGLLPPQLLMLILVGQLQKPLINVCLLLRLRHDLREAHGKRVLLQVLGVDLLLSELRESDLVDVG